MNKYPYSCQCHGEAAGGLKIEFLSDKVEEGQVETASYLDIGHDGPINLPDTSRSRDR